MSNKSDPCAGFEAITPSDTVDFTMQCNAIYVGGTGDITAINADGDAVTFANVTAGSVIPVVTSRVNATATTATDLVALYQV